MQALSSLRVFLSVVLVASPLSASGAQPQSSSEAKPVALDVTLQPGRLLIGQLVDPNGVPQPGETVRVLLADGATAEVKTNEQGGFAFRGVRGVAQLDSEKAVAIVRGWEPGTAPPSATPAVLLVEQEELTRGQYYPGPGAQGVVSRTKVLMGNPLFVAGVVGTAVAIPVAIANNDDDPVSP